MDGVEVSGAGPSYKSCSEDVFCILRFDGGGGGNEEKHPKKGVRAYPVQ